ncbi:uncharacterized protein MONBRDRAFT_9057 [Monosiga brevicollis MX1]|uniref:Uncharacterized protein n=1 Tax=Monosiga brevicollis TaxID=81824 RepID=A9V1Y6_MONBE|nr:uncharacterized protein MONBRDRAFT_9057 [Monosiga brevicollis MX1]EDQ88646.1 predicted protein [Monosiga brevicollis MX1]|eukprot:XP_001746750.1 hypothetical protein [Monosiga brevicollis MX1]
MGDESLYAVGPCEWDWDIEVCYNKNQGVSCYEFFRDCPTDRCSYDDNTATACTEMYDQSDCTASSTGCTWYPTDELCWPSDLDLPCHLVSDWEQCPTDRCHLVNTSEFGGVCLNINEPVWCDNFGDESYCPSDHCSWDSALTRCYNSKLGVECGDYFDISTCPADHCKVENNACVDKDEPIDCSSFYFNSADCSPVNGCFRNCSSSLCLRCDSETSCSNVTCPAAPTADPGSACADLVDEAACVGDSDCQWFSTVHACAVRSPRCKHRPPS